MAWLSVRQYQGFNFASFDTGNMGQAIWSFGQGQPLIFTTEGVAWSRLALHVGLIYFLLVTLYALFPSPITLYLVQTALYASAGVAVYRLAVRRFGTMPALLLISRAPHWLLPFLAITLPTLLSNGPGPSYD